MAATWNYGEDMNVDPKVVFMGVACSPHRSSGRKLTPITAMNSRCSNWLPEFGISGFELRRCMSHSPSLSLGFPLVEYCIFGAWIFHNFKLIYSGKRYFSLFLPTKCHSRQCVSRVGLNTAVDLTHTRAGPSYDEEQRYKPSRY